MLAAGCGIAAHPLIPSFRHGEPYPRCGAGRAHSRAGDARSEAGSERFARAAPPLKTGDIEGCTARLVHHAYGRPLAGRRLADLVHWREQAVLGRALEVSGSTGGLVPRDLRNASRGCEGVIMRTMLRDASRSFRAFRVCYSSGIGWGPAN